ncbi:hypothetical protein [uncultured Marinobacter sp.]|uniref:hypothetical protein n=1 Tax=uncultured Marinobacter sp. TaxID=187379 RepID=UPI002593051B|nr:hypothetical protein [uncultured Marinobacter sp.]
MINKAHRWSLSALASNVLKPALALSAALLFSGCSELGYLLSNDKVTDADNDQVVFVGDSIFAPTIEREEEEGFFRFERERRYGLN